MKILDKLRRNKKPTADDYGRMMMALATEGNISKAKELLAAVESETMVRLFLVEQYRDKDGDNAIVMAAWRGHAEMVELLVKAGASIDSTRKCNNSSLLYLASEHGHAGVVKVCLAHGADLHLATTGGAHPLWVATRNGREDIMEILLQAGADVDRPCCDKYTPLIVAVGKFKLSAVRLLLGWGAKLDLVDKDGDTAETTASKMGHSEALELLVEAKQVRKGGFFGWPLGR